MPIHGIKSYVTLYPETVWGATPGSPTLIYLPAESYTVQMQNERRNQTPMLGIRQRKHGRSYRGMPAGQIACKLFGWNYVALAPSIAQRVLEWGFGSNESLELPSYGALWAEGPDDANKRHTGLRVNSATLVGSADGGTIDLTLDVMGQDEEGQVAVGPASAFPIPNDMNALTDFEFADSTLTIGGVAADMQSFQLQTQNGLKATYNNSTRPQLLLPGDRLDSLQLTLIKDDETYDIHRRILDNPEFAIVLTLKGLHMGTGATGNYVQVVITIPRAAYMNHTDQRDKELYNVPLEFECLKPDTVSNGMSMAFSLV